MARQKSKLARTGNEHHENGRHAKNLDTDTLISMTETFRVLGDVTRLKICLALSRQELCVGDIADLLHLTDSAVSHQLRMMKTMRLVRYRRAGKMSYYTLDDEHIEQLIGLGLRHVSEN